MLKFFLRLIALAVFAAPLVVAAAPLTCGRFKEKLSAEIHAGGDQVAQPFGWSKTKGGEPYTEEFRGIVGLEGFLTCMNGKLFSFGAQTLLKGGRTEVRDRETRVIALGAATICAVEATATNSCNSAARRMYLDALKEMEASVHRGDESPAGVGQCDLVHSGADFQYDATAVGLVSFTLNVTPKDSVEDLGK